MTKTQKKNKKKSPSMRPIPCYLCENGRAVPPEEVLRFVFILTEKKKGKKIEITAAHAICFKKMVKEVERELAGTAVWNKIEPALQMLIAIEAAGRLAVPANQEKP